MQNLNYAQPSLGEIVRTALASATSGTLATVDSDGRPLLRVVPIVDDGAGAPVTVLSNLASQTIRARQDARGAVTITGPDGVSQVLIQGDLAPVPGLQQIDLQESFLASHSHLETQVESIDFSWLRLVPLRVCWIDAAGHETWLSANDLAVAQADPLALSRHNTAWMDELVGSVASRIGEDLVLMAKTLAGRWLASDAELLGIDRYGLRIAVTGPGETRDARIPFPTRLDEVDELDLAIAGLVRAARSAPSAQETASLLDSVERHGGSRPHVDGVDGSRHGNANSLFDSLESADGQSWSLCPEQDGDTLIGVEPEITKIDGVVAGSESECHEPVLFDDVEPGWERIEPGVRESEGLAHADTSATSVEGVTTAGVEEIRVDA